MASLGEHYAREVLELAPYAKAAIGRAVLDASPTYGFGLLLEACVGYPGNENNDTSHPMRSIRDYCRDRSGAIDGRRALLAVAKQWVTEGGDADVAVRAVAVSVDPTFEFNDTDPGLGRTVYFQNGLIGPDHLKEIASLWDEVIPLVVSLRCTTYQPLLEVFDEWAFCGRLPRENVPDDIRSWMKSIADGVAARLSAALTDERGVRAHLARTASRAGLTVQVQSDDEFEALFPDENIEALKEDWQAEQDRQIEIARAWGRQVSELEATVLVGKIMALEREARRGNVTYPRWSPVATEEIALLVPEPERSIPVLIGEGCAADILYPFVLKLVIEQRPGWQDTVRQLLKDESYRWAALGICLSRPTSPEVGALAVAACDSNVARLLETLCARRELQGSLVVPLLNHPDPIVAGAVAVGIKRENMVPSGDSSIWENAIVNYPSDDYWLGIALQDRLDLVERWVAAWCERAAQGKYERVADSMKKLLIEMDEDAKIPILKLFATSKYSFIIDDLIGGMIGGSLNMVKRIFEDSELKALQNSALALPIDASWLDRARLAVNSGWSLEKVVVEPQFSEHGWTGEESDHLAGFISDFESLPADDEVSASIRSAGIKHYTQLRNAALAKEKIEAIEGY